MFESFDISTLEIGDIIHFQYSEGDLGKGLIASINNILNTSKKEYTVNYSTYSMFLNEREMAREIVKYAYWVRRPFNGLELI